MAAPTTPILDRFNRADVSPLPSAMWGIRLSGGAKVVSNQAQPVDASFDETAWINPFGNDQEAYFTVGALPSGSVLTLVYRAQSATAWDNYYRLDIASSSARVNKIVSAVTTALGTGVGLTLNIGDQLWVKVVGSLHQYFQNGTLLESFTDSSIPSGAFIGFGFSSNSGAIDDFGGGDIVSPVMFRGA